MSFLWRRFARVASPRGARRTSEPARPPPTRRRRPRRGLHGTRTARLASARSSRGDQAARAGSSRAQRLEPRPLLPGSRARSRAGRGAPGAGPPRRTRPQRSAVPWGGSCRGVISDVVRMTRRRVAALSERVLRTAVPRAGAAAPADCSAEQERGGNAGFFHSRRPARGNFRRRRRTFRECFKTFRASPSCKLHW